MAKDVIMLRGLTANGHHGVNQFERDGSQPFSVDLSMLVDTGQAAQTDDLNQTESYADIADDVVKVLRGPSVYLIETLASRIADVVLARARVLGVVVTVHKPRAPIHQKFSDVSITVARGEPLPSLPQVADSKRRPRIPHWDGDDFNGDDRHGDDRHGDDLKGEDLQGDVFRGDGRQGDGRKGDPVDDAVGRANPGEDRVNPRDERGASAQVVIALGGNLEHPPVNLSLAVLALLDMDGLSVDAVSPLVRTAPVLAAGQEAQPDYWNAVVLAHTRLSPKDLLHIMQRIESELGRVRHQHWGARTVDLDLIQYQGVTSRDPELTLPHPRAFMRAFVLYPWSLVDSAARLEGVGPVAALLAQAPDVGGVLDAVDRWLEHPETVEAESDRILAQHRPPDRSTAAHAAGSANDRAARRASDEVAGKSAGRVAGQTADRVAGQVGDRATRRAAGQTADRVAGQVVDQAARRASDQTAGKTAGQPSDRERTTVGSHALDFSADDSATWDSPLLREVQVTRVHAKRAKAALVSDQSFVEEFRAGGDDPVFSETLQRWKASLREKNSTQPESKEAAPSTPSGSDHLTTSFGVNTGPVAGGLGVPAASAPGSRVRPAPPSRTRSARHHVAPVHRAAPEPGHSEPTHSKPARPEPGHSAARPEPGHSAARPEPGRPEPGRPEPGHSVARPVTHSEPPGTAPTGVAAPEPQQSQPRGTLHDAPGPAASDRDQPAAPDRDRPSAQADSSSMPTWKPLRGGRRQPQHRAKSDEAALPSWDFNDRKMRIVDDSKELRPVDEEEQPADGASPSPELATRLAELGTDGPAPQQAEDDADVSGEPGVVRRSILQPRLAADTPVGPLQRDNHTQTEILRRMTLRPTATGMVPVRDHQNGRGDSGQKGNTR